MSNTVSNIQLHIGHGQADAEFAQFIMHLGTDVLGLLFASGYNLFTPDFSRTCLQTVYKLRDTQNKKSKKLVIKMIVERIKHNIAI